jgi:hypothetical protein
MFFTQIEQYGHGFQGFMEMRRREGSPVAADGDIACGHAAHVVVLGAQQWLRVAYIRHLTTCTTHSHQAISDLQIST